MAYDNIYNEKPTNSLIPEGVYECILTAEEKRNKFNQEIELNLCFRIRKEIGQSNEGRLVFSTVKHDKNYPDEYNHSIISSILGTVPERKSFKDNEQLIQFLNGLCILTPIYIEKANEYHDTDKNKINFFKLSASNVPPTESEKKEFGLNNVSHDGSTVANDDDLPF